MTTAADDGELLLMRACIGHPPAARRGHRHAALRRLPTGTDQLGLEERRGERGSCLDDGEGSQGAGNV